MPKVSQEHLEARREQILDGARRAFAGHGYEGTTVTVLEEEIGLSLDHPFLLKFVAVGEPKSLTR